MWHNHIEGFFERLRQPFHKFGTLSKKTNLGKPCFPLFFPHSPSISLLFVYALPGPLQKKKGLYLTWINSLIWFTIWSCKMVVSAVWRRWHATAARKNSLERGKVHYFSWFPYCSPCTVQQPEGLCPSPAIKNAPCIFWILETEMQRLTRELCFIRHRLLHKLQITARRDKNLHSHFQVKQKAFF